MATAQGVRSKRIAETPIAILDLETTGLTPGVDRVVEIGVVRLDPGREPRLVLDTLVNPLRPVAATEIHGITDDDVKEAPPFFEIAGDLVAALDGCVIAAYNVYFDMGFLNAEFIRAGIRHEAPHVCLMYFRPLLGIGRRCRLEVACLEHNIPYHSSHMAATDARASAELLRVYLDACKEAGVETFADLACRAKYKYLSSLGMDPFPAPSVWGLVPSGHVCSRCVSQSTPRVADERAALRSYWDLLATLIADLHISDEELTEAEAEKARLGLKPEQVRMLHARAFASIITRFCEDKWLDDAEALKLKHLHRCLSRLGWAPGE